MGDEELDYMSDTLLESISASAPGLVTVRSIARQRTGEQNGRKRQLPRSLQEAQVRDEGLQKQVDCTNKGFNLLMKMGYKPGQGLGKNSEGRQDPVPIHLPEGRSGLGLEAEKREKRVFREQLRERVVQLKQNNFRSAMAERFRLSRVRRQLVKARYMCLQLDMEKSITVPVDPSYWPSHGEPVDQSIEPSTSQSPELKKSKLHHLDDDLSSDLSDEPPSPTNVDEDPDGTMSLSTSTAENAEQILCRIVRYLRRKHSFCFWCSVQYDSADQLLRQCPGPEEADHD